MAVKRDVHEKCSDCGEVIARIKGDYVWFGGHRCKSKPALSGRPETPPRPVSINSVNFIPAED